jgi:hypothetical protein
VGAVSIVVLLLLLAGLLVVCFSVLRYTQFKIYAPLSTESMPFSNVLRFRVDLESEEWVTFAQQPSALKNSWCYCSGFRSLHGLVFFIFLACLRCLFNPEKNRVTINCWCQRRRGAVGVHLSWRRHLRLGKRLF